MSEPENFLSRWSRRKQEVAREDVARDGDGEAAAKDDAAMSPAAEAGAEPQAGTGERADAAEPAFDLSKLPSIDAITADTDIRPFLAAGVPASLRQAALRRAWSADPKIRDFIEMAENQWDFTGASEVAGFDFSAPAGDVKRMVAEMFGERQPEAVRERERAAEPDAPAQESVNQLRVTGNEAERRAGDDDVAPNNGVRLSEVSSGASFETNDVASQNNDALQNEPVKISRRSHGSAMPK